MLPGLPDPFLHLIVKNSFEYNKDAEVTCKLTNAKDRSVIYELLQKIKFGRNNYEDIVTRPDNW